MATGTIYIMCEELQTQPHFTLASHPVPSHAKRAWKEAIHFTSHLHHLVVD